MKETVEDSVLICDPSVFVKSELIIENYIYFCEINHDLQ